MSVYIIAEIGVNHNGSVDLAKELILSAAKCGADAVKFQTFKSEELVTKSANKARYQRENDDSTSTQYEMLKKLELTDEDFFELDKYCSDCNIDFMTTCFDLGSLRAITSSLEPKFLKIGSGEITNIPFLIEHAKTGRDIILSTGMSTLGEIEDALAALAFGYKPGNTNKIKNFSDIKFNLYNSKSFDLLKEKVKLLHCVTDYPAAPSDLNLKAISILINSFGLEVGYSDHSIGIEASCAAVALGASCLEKHITLDKNLEGPDHKASATPDEFKQLVNAIRNLELALDKKVKAPSEKEKENIPIARKYIVADKPIKKGEKISAEMLAIKRSSFGRSPKDWWSIIDSYAQRDYESGENID